MDEYYKKDQQDAFYHEFNKIRKEILSKKPLQTVKKMLKNSMCYIVSIETRSTSNELKIYASSEDQAINIAKDIYSLDNFEYTNQDLIEWFWGLDLKNKNAYLDQDDIKTLEYIQEITQKDCLINPRGKTEIDVVVNMIREYSDDLFNTLTYTYNMELTELEYNFYAKHSLSSDLDDLEIEWLEDINVNTEEGTKAFKKNEQYIEKIINLMRG